HGALGDRSARSDQRRHLFHERPPRAVRIIAPPDALPPHDPHPCHTGHIMQHPSAPPTTSRDDPARRTPSRCRRRRDGHDQQIIEAVDMLDVDAIETEQQVAAGTRAEGGTRVSAPRSRVKHVEVLVTIRWLALLILGDLDPYPRIITRRS